MRKIFIVVAGGNPAAERHFEDTIQRKRSIAEVENYLPPDQLNNLKNIYHGADFIVWGSVPGLMNTPRWDRMDPGDVVLIYNSGRIRFAGEVAAKVRNKDLARYFWRETEDKATWELMYFIVNEETVDVPLAKLNPFFGYSENYAPRGFTQIDQEKVKSFAANYGDILGVLKSLENNEEIIPVAPVKTEIIEEKIEQATTEHDEMQWRLIRLGEMAKLDVWVPANDQNKQYKGNIFRDHILREFQQGLDVAPTIKNIDVVWKFGPYSIKSAFEIEHSTSVYSGILRLSDLRAETPNSTFPLFIVADRARKQKVLNELLRPTFSSPALRLNEVVKYLSYDDVRQVDNEARQEFNPETFQIAGVSP
ncbi:hypothetical protein A3F05_02225 [Candidatus Saccharibacteria bacterium RIFCSPHIGHO2_12_FULL_47_17]|nr:MAG: hypothetical protein A3F05_02225 [Candidatus Saccharibacteria bacterium RIFCSPHIGHO2_12_FULL_47_17]